jgi:ABC-2 type transport system permease protein
MRFKEILVNLISGFVLPLSFFPLWFQKASYFMPFQYIVSVPINIWIGKFTVEETVIMLALQVVWIGVLYFIVAIAWKKAMHQLTAVGV